MSLFKQKRQVVGEPEKKSPLKLIVNFKLLIPGNYDVKDVASIELTESLVCDTDSPIKQLMNEVEAIAAEAFEKIKNKVEITPKLSDGYWLEKEQKDKENQTF